MIPSISPKVDNNKVEVKDSCNPCCPSSCFSKRAKHKHHKPKIQEQIIKIERTISVDRRPNSAT
jgi:hypothetical protein